MSNEKGIGAPVGGRVHWLLWCLHREFKKAHKLRFDDEYHNYHFTRYDGRTPIDEYIVIRTSRRCFRCMYYSFENNYFEYFSRETSKEMAEHMEWIFERALRVEKNGIEFRGQKSR